MEFFEKLKQYIVSPPAIESIWDFLLAFLILFGPWLFLVWVFAVFLRLLVAPFRETLGARSGAELSWAWGLLGLSILLVVDLGIAWFFGNLKGWSAATPILFFEILGAVLALLIWKDEHRSLKSVQNHLLKAQKGAK